jgi:plasmid stability protein
MIGLTVTRLDEETLERLRLRTEERGRTVEQETGEVPYFV